MGKNKLLKKIANLSIKKKAKFIEDLKDLMGLENIQVEVGPTDENIKEAIKESLEIPGMDKLYSKILERMENEQ